MYHRESIGQLIVGPRAPGESFNSADWRLINDLARHAGIAVNAARLTIDLQQARARLVTLCEEERRRLRNEMHDRLGPLAALGLKVGSAYPLLKDDPVALEALLSSVETDLGAAIADLRELAYHLRPPVIDQLGLVEALRALVIQVQQREQHYTVVAPIELPPLSAAIEFAIYRIMQEALGNVARHAQAKTCQVSLSIDDQVYLDICDDGCAMSADHRIGVGLTSMRERAEELGSTCQIESIAGRGTCIHVILPHLISHSSEPADPTLQ